MNKIAVLTSGGDAPGMNAAIRAVVRCAAFHGIQCMGIEQGFEGLMDGIVRRLEIRHVGSIIQRGGTILRTSRSPRFLTEEGRQIAMGQLEKHEVDGLVVIGGDGSFHGAHELHKLGMSVVGVPGTIDNDVYGTDNTIGFDTALNTALSAVRRLRDTAFSHDRLFILEVMGRDAGFITLHTAVAGGAEYAILPEEKFDLDKLCATIDASRARGKHYSVIVLAEGVMSGFELKKLLEAHDKKYTCHVTVLGHVQRGGSPTCYDAMIASRMGAYAVHCLMEGKSDVMAGIHNDMMVSVPLVDTWEKKKPLNPELLSLVHELSL